MSPQLGTRPILSTSVILSQCGISYWVREDRCLEVRKTRRDKSPNVRTFLPRLDPTAYYCLADSWRREGRVTRGESQVKKRHQWRITGGEERRAATTKSRLAFFNVETSSPRVPRDVKRENREGSHGKKLCPPTSLDGRLQRSQIKSLKRFRDAPRVLLWKISFTLIGKCGSFMRASRKCYFGNALLTTEKAWKSFVNSLSRVREGFAPLWDPCHSSVGLWSH